MKYFIISCLTIITSLPGLLKAQLIKFSATLTPSNSALVNWTMAPGFTCQDLRLDHSTDSIHFEPVYFHAGVCGDALEAVSYSFEHTCFTCFGENYYRLSLGFNEFSDTLTLSKLSIAGSGLTTYPNPVIEKLNLSWIPAQSSFVTLFIFDQNGKMFFSERLPDLGSAMVNVSELPVGSYIVSVETSKSMFSSKFLKTTF